MRLQRLVTLALVLLISGAAGGCSKVPVTGRTQMNLISPDRMQQTSLKRYNQFLEKNEVVEGTTQARNLKTVGQDIASTVENYLREEGFEERIEDFNWKFNLIESDAVNAWAMPGGKIAFYTGIVDICQDKNGIAVVMGHEIAHAIARHGNERMSQMLATRLGGQALSIALTNQPGPTRDLLLQAYGMGAKVGVTLPFSRKHESEADEMGLMFMAMAGYDPREAVRFWQRMREQSSKEKPPAFLSTHPPTKERIKELRSYMDEAMQYYNRNS